MTDKARIQWLAWGVGAWSLLVPTLATLVFGWGPASVLGAVGTVLLAGLVGELIVFPIVLGSLAWWAIRAIYALVRGTALPSLEHATTPGRRHAAAAAVLATPLVLAAGALGGFVAGLGASISGARIAAIAGFAWLGLVGPSVAAALGWLPAEAAFLVLLVAAMPDAVGEDPQGSPEPPPDRPARPERPEPRPPVTPQPP